VQISVVRNDGHWEQVWERPDVLSESVDGTQSLILPVSGSAVSVGDYVIEALRANSTVHDTYVYRVTGPQ
jgi:hypothetical protein